MLRKLRAITFLFTCCITLSVCATALASDKKETAPSTGFDALGLESPRSIYTRAVTDRSFFAPAFNGKVVDVTESGAKSEIVQEKQEDKIESTAKDSTSDREKILGRVDKSAPEPFLDIVYNFRKGDVSGAREGAKRYVDYMTNLMFEVRAITRLIGEAFIQQNMIEEEEWVGVEQYIDWTFASARAEQGSPFKLTHEAALRRITPAADGAVEVYYFFTLNSKWSREMSVEVERLWRVAKGDKKIKMVGLMLGETPPSWLRSYRDYTGLTLPIVDGAELAKKFSIGLVPAVVVVTPENNKAYVKTGQQDFVRLYEFVKTAQGLPTTLTPELQRLATAPIGAASLSQSANVKVTGARERAAKSVVKATKVNTMERF